MSDLFKSFAKGVINAEFRPGIPHQRSVHLKAESLGMVGLEGAAFCPTEGHL
jgi:hypothetical protein